MTPLVGRTLSHLPGNLVLMSTNPVANESLVQIRPRPTQAPRLEDPNLVPQHRRLDCQAYDGCIDLAVEGGWDGFHCNACQAYEPLTPQQRAKDLHSILEMLAETEILPGVMKQVGMGRPDVLPEVEPERQDAGVFDESDVVACGWV
jgi:hypothetical protein